MKAQRASAWLLIMALIVAPWPVASQGILIEPEVEILWSAGKWLATTVGAYLVNRTLDVVFDRPRARETERSLQKAEQILQATLEQGKADRKQVEAELAVAHRELHIVRQFMKGTPSKAQLAQYQQELTSDLQLIQKTLEEHERRLDEHDRRLAEQGKIQEDQGREQRDLKRKVDDLAQRLDQQPSLRPPVASLPPGGRPPGIRPPYSSAAELKIEIKGPENLIRLREATHPVRMGRFSFSRSRGQASYFLLPSTHVVVELFAPNNRIFMPSHLADQVQIISHGWYYQTLVY